MQDVFEERRPEVVFHAAALKHVNMLEQHPGEAVQTNVRGTLNVLRPPRRSASSVRQHLDRQGGRSRSTSRPFEAHR